MYKRQNDGFPSQYKSIRAARANISTITPLGGIGGKGRTPVRQGIGAATGGFEVEVQNYNIIVKKRNVSDTISMPPIGKDDPMGCLSCPPPHSIAESLWDGQPVVIILSDQSFPPSSPQQLTATVSSSYGWRTVSFGSWRKSSMIG